MRNVLREWQQRGWQRGLSAVILVLVMVSADTAQALDVAVNTVRLRLQESDVEHLDTGLGVWAEARVLQPLNKTWSWVIAAATAYRVKSSFFPITVRGGMRFYGDSLSTRIRPYLLGMGEFRHDVRKCDLEEEGRVNCRQTVVSATASAGFEISFNSWSYFFLEKILLEAPLFYMIDYIQEGTEKRKTQGFEFEVSTVSTLSFKFITFGFGVRF